MTKRGQSLRFVRHWFGDNPWHGIEPPETFRAVVEREKARVDRNSHMFCLLTLNVHDQGDAGRVRSLIKTVSARKRKTDVIGWIDESRVGVILPDTPPQGAQIVGASVCKNLTSDAWHPTWEVYAYPPERIENSGHQADPRQMSFFDNPNESARVPTAPLPAACVRLGVGSDMDRTLVPACPWWKRLIDVVGAVAMLIVLSPLLLLCALAVRIISPGPAFLSQERVGFLGQRFACWKLRTMVWNADQGVHQKHLHALMRSTGPMVKLDKCRDPRLIPVLGKVLRSSGIDELPQLFNVLRGDMSLVGPRPCLPYEYEQYERWHKQRFNSRPGLTGLWQVSGKNRTSFADMMRLDISYAGRLSPAQDTRILLRTLPAVVNEVKDTLAS